MSATFQHKEGVWKFLALPSKGECSHAAPVSLMEKYLNDPSNDYRTLKFGDVMDGTIMRVDRDEILVDIGSKSEGIVPAKEFSCLTSSEKQSACDR